MSVVTTSPLLTVHGLIVRFGGVAALDGATLTVGSGSICGLIGPNGAGKTTLFNVISGLYRPLAGSVHLGPVDLLHLAPHHIVACGVARTFQNLGLFWSRTVFDNVLVGAHHWTRSGFLACGLRLPLARREERLATEEVEAVLRRLDLLRLARRRVGDLPFGTLKRVELARALASRPRLLLLDEPANGLALGEVHELGRLIVELRDELSLTILLVEHHMGLVMSVSDWVVALNYGQVIAEGPPPDVQRHPAVISAYLGAGVTPA